MIEELGEEELYRAKERKGRERESPGEMVGKKMKLEGLRKRKKGC